MFARQEEDAPTTGLPLLIAYRVLGAVVACIGTAQLLSEPSGDGLAIAILASLAAGAAVAFLPEHLIPSIAVVAGATILVAAAISEPPFAMFIAMLLSVFAAVRLGGRREVLVAIAATLLVNVAVATRDFQSEDTRPFDLIYPLVYFGGAFLIGFAARRQAFYIEEAARREEALRLEQDALAQQATEAERARIARELHDVVSHGVSLMVVQAEAAREVVATRPDQAAIALDAVSEAGRRAITDLRAMLDVLHESEVKRDLSRLLAPVRGAGLKVELRDSAHASSLPEDVWLTVYRVVQEAATNTLRHADAKQLDIEITNDGRVVIVEVTDDGRGTGSQSGSGRGLEGMRERVTGLGGQLIAATVSNGAGFKVRAEIPIAFGAELA